MLGVDVNGLVVRQSMLFLLPNKRCTGHLMKKRNQYLKVVEWSEEDQCFIGRVQGLTLGGVHGKNEAKVYEKLCDLVDEWVMIYEEDAAPLPVPTT